MDILYPFLVVLISVLIQSSTGFGFAIIAIPLLMLQFEPHTAIFLSGAISLVSCYSALPSIWRTIERATLFRVFTGSLIGLPLGGFLYFTMPVEWLKLLVSLCILAATAFMIKQVVFPLGKGRRIGIVSGALTTSVGMPGPPLILLLTMQGLNKQAFRSTSIAFYCLVYPISLTFQWISDRVVAQSLIHAYWYIPAIFIGQWLGSALHKQFNPVWFRRITFLLLLATALNALIPSLMTLYH
ncbi:MAG: hypothetical protein K0R67_3749 [Paenibacillus sp.]|nr:hypothetical protein [Paenibacillus sp.]